MTHTNHETACVACQIRPRAIGLVCIPCSLAITTSISLLPDQIVDTIEVASADVLLDQWGRPHNLATCTAVGRVVTTATSIAILDASVSRRHACITRTRGTWRVVDSGSSNGTLVNREQVTEHELVHGDQITFGGVGFCVAFAIALPLEPVAAAAILDLATLVRGPLPQLSVSELELVDILTRRMREDVHLPYAVRGFVRPAELAEALWFDVCDGDHMRVEQLVLRARHTLHRAGIGDVIECRDHLGYRLRLSFAA
jgi:hypothetical protein